MCECCKDVKEGKDRGIPEDIIDLILNLQLDVDYYSAILSGNWPSGKRVLEEALKKYEGKDETISD